MPQTGQSRTHSVVPASAGAADPITALHQLALSLSARPLLHDILAQALLTAAQLTSSPHATLLLLDQAGTQICYRVALDNGNLAPLELVAGPMMQRGLAGWVARERRAVLVGDTERDARWLPGPGLGDLRSALVTPIVYGEHILGVITLGHEEPQHYHAEHLTLLEIISAQSALALSIARQAGAALPQPNNTPTTGDVVVLAAAIERLSAAAGSLAPAHAFGDVLGAFFQTAAAIIERHGGSVATIGGDRLLAVFRAPERMLLAAVAAGELLAATQHLRERWHARFGIGTGRLNIGIADGALTIGQLATTPPATYLSGAAAERARRLCELARGDILISEPIARALAGHPEMRARRLQPFRLDQGAPQPVFQLSTYPQGEPTPSPAASVTPGAPR